MLTCRAGKNFLQLWWNLAVFWTWNGCLTWLEPIFFSAGLKLLWHWDIRNNQGLSLQVSDWGAAWRQQECKFQLWLFGIVAPCCSRTPLCLSSGWKDFAQFHFTLKFLLTVSYLGHCRELVLQNLCRHQSNL